MPLEPFQLPPGLKLPDPKTLPPGFIDTLRAQLAKLTPAQREEFIRENRRRLTQQMAERRLYTLFPDEGPLRRELYPKHIAFFRAGGKHDPMPWCPPDCDGSPHQERALIAANRTGKTLAVCYELTCHLAGWYPEWWPGRRFKRPISAWAAGEDVKAVRESLQSILLGPPGSEGTGVIPKASIVNTTPRAGVPEAVDTIIVKYAEGGQSRLLLKTYDQGRESFQAAKIDVGACDEEPPGDIYSEMLTRTMSTVPGEPNGVMLCSFTPLSGLSDVVLSYLPGGKPVTK